MKVLVLPSVMSVASMLAIVGGVPASVVRADPVPNIVFESFEWLPDFPNQGFAHATAANANGDFCGYMGAFQEFRYVNNTPINGTFDAVMRGMNDKGVTVGDSFHSTPPFALVSQGAGLANVIQRMRYYDVNNEGWVVGVRYANDNTERQVLIDDLGMNELPGPAFYRLIDEQGRVWGMDPFNGPKSVYVKPRFGSPQNLGSFGGDGAEVRFVNRNGDWCGVRYFNDGTYDAMAVVDGNEHFVSSQASSVAHALAVTVDGQIIGTDLGLCNPICDGNVWVVKNGVRHDLEVEVSGFLGYSPELWVAEAASDNGWIIGHGRNPATNSFAWFRMKIQVDLDSDGDGLFDFWESQNGGIDANQDNVIDFKPYDLGARPDHKDLFVEVDAGSIPLGDGEVSKILFAFDNAPVDNPDGTTGIRLHILRDETNLPLPNANVIGGNFPEGFNATKAAHFGTVAERSDPNATNILKAKAKAVRYAVIYDGLQFLGNARRYDGIAQIGGNDFLVDFAGLTYNNGFRDEDDRAATFMHELGHTLGLMHGGALDSITLNGPRSHQGKPNYPSIMNYALSRPMRWSNRFWTLDYSREELPSLNENALDETRGIASTLYRNYSMPYGIGPEIARTFRLVKLDGRRVDFDADGVMSSSASQDLNFLPETAGIAGTSTPTPGDTMSGHNDWQNIQYRVVVDERELAFNITLAEGCPDSESIEALDAAIPVPCDADFNGDGLVDDLDFQVFVVAYDKLLCDEEDGGGGPQNRAGVGPGPGGTQPDCPCDLNNDRLVDDLDFQIFVTAYDEVLCS